jgi:hypothetical protein
MTFRALTGSLAGCRSAASGLAMGKSGKTTVRHGPLHDQVALRFRP